MIFLNSAVSLLALATLSTAALTPADIDWSQHQWIKPGPGDARSPCPGLNTLANHGFLPRNGKDIRVPTIIQASLDGFNVQPDVVSLPAKVGLTTTTSPETFNLNDINMHNSIEHDASLSRGDFAFGDNFSFNETLFQALVNTNPDVNFYNATAAGEAQRVRLLHSQSVNPTLINTRKEFSIRSRESALYISVMGNVTAGQAPKEFVNIFFREERLPLAEGWSRSAVPIDGRSMSPMTQVIVAASRWQGDGKDPSIDFVVAEGSVFHV